MLRLSQFDGEVAHKVGYIYSLVKIVKSRTASYWIIMDVFEMCCLNVIPLSMCINPKFIVFGHHANALVAPVTYGKAIKR